MNYSAMFLFGTFSWTISEVLSSLNASTNSQSSRSLENVAAQELFFKALKAQRESVCVCVCGPYYAFQMEQKLFSI